MKDLIVVGAGPVGSHLAGKMSEKGLEVLVIERSSEIGRPLACSGHVSPDIWSFVLGDERERLLQNRVRGANFHTESGKEYSFYRDETVSYVIDRVELDKVKAQEAREKGVEYHLEETVEKVEEREEMVEVETDRGSYRASMVAGCDGASSTVRTEVGLEEPERFYQGMLCFSEEDDSSDFVDVHLEVPDFFGWRIPRGDSVEYGVAVPRKENPKEWLDRITGQYISPENQQNICAGAIPVGPPESVTSKRVFLVGDAAAQTKPFTGGGILYGLRAADKAAETVDVEDKSSLQRYEKAWRNELMNEIRAGKVIEKTYSMPETLQRIGMKFFEGKIGVHMDEPSSLVSIRQFKSLFR